MPASTPNKRFAYKSMQIAKNKIARGAIVGRDTRIAGGIVTEISMGLTIGIPGQT